MSVADYSLTRESEWVNTCRMALSNVTYERNVTIDEAIIVQREAFECSVIDQFQNAASIIDTYKNNVEIKKSRGYLMQLVAEYTNCYNEMKAQEIQLSAKKLNPGLLSPIKGYQYQKLISSSNQAEYLYKFLIDNDINKNQYILKVNAILDDLAFSNTNADLFEKALKDISEYIGYGSSRPEKENRSGPDNLWCLGAGCYLVIECKNCTITDTICKSDCNQLNGSIQWFKTEYGVNGFTCTPIMIHNSYIFNSDCSPREDVRIVTPNKLNDLKQAIKDFAQALIMDAFKDTKVTKELLDYYKLDPENIIKTYTEKFRKK